MPHELPLNVPPSIQVQMQIDRGGLDVVMSQLVFNRVWLFCIFPYDDPVVAILLIRLLRVYLIILRWPVFLVDDFEFVVAGTESSA